MPVFINATCDLNIQSQYMKYAYDISYDSEYDEVSKKFNVTLYNVNDKLTVKYNGINYRIENNKVLINGVNEGTEMSISLFGPSGCDDPVRLIYINQPYSNPFYGSTMCYGYDGKISYCTYKFIKTKPTEKLVSDAIYNYNSSLVKVEEEKPQEEVVITFGERVLDFVDNRFLKIFMFIFTGYVTYVIYNDLYIKVKHKL
jgi:hypothetical protein